MGNQDVTFTYTNYRGEVSTRLVSPLEWYFGKTEFYPDPQWLMRGHDLNKKAERTFAVKNIKDWDPAP